MNTILLIAITIVIVVLSIWAGITFSKVKVNCPPDKVCPPRKVCPPEKKCRDYLKLTVEEFEKEKKKFLECNLQDSYYWSTSDGKCILAPCGLYICGRATTCYRK